MVLGELWRLPLAKNRFCESMQILFSRVDFPLRVRIKARLVDSYGFGRVMAESCLNLDLAQSDLKVITGRPVRQSGFLETKNKKEVFYGRSRP